MNIRFQWLRSPDQLAGDVEAWGIKVQSRAIRRAEGLAGEAEGWMKANAPWQDRTGNARASLSGVASRQGHTVTIVLSHGVDYGIYLETMQAGTYAILGPAINYWGPRLLEGFFGSF